MKITCEDRDKIFADGTPAEWAALEAHSANCAACAGEIRAWKELSVSANELRDYSDTPTLWPRIEQALVAEAHTKKRRADRWGLLSFGMGSLGWQTAAAAALVVILTVSTIWIYVHRTPPGPVDQSLLKNPALAEVELTQAAYEQAIDKLSAEAKPQLENPATPLQASYREKLQVLDSAISDLRAQAGMNPSNAHLRRQLLAMYQEKQQTLEEILEATR